MLLDFQDVSHRLTNPIPWIIKVLWLFGFAVQAKNTDLMSFSPKILIEGAC